MNLHGSSMFTAVDAVLVLLVSPARDNTKCRHSTQQTLFVPLSMNPSALDISISTINPYHYYFFINSPFLWNNIPTNLLQITNRKLSALRFTAFFFNLYYLTIFVLVCVVSYMCYCFVHCMCCCFGEHICRPRLLCNPYLLTKIDNYESQ